MKRRIFLKRTGGILGAAVLGGGVAAKADSSLSPPSPSAISPTARVLGKRYNKDGWAITRIHYSVVPGYDYEAAAKGLSEEAKRAELEIDWTASKGKRVYPEFSPQLHRSLTDLPFNPAGICYCGWDFGGTPAFVLTQLNLFGQWLIFPSLSPLEDTSLGIYDF